VKKVLAATLLAALAATARAESPRRGSFDLSVGWYRPDVDSEFAAGPGPFETAFGRSRVWMFRAGAAKALFTGVGSLEVGLQTGYLQKNGKGQLLGGGASGDETKFRIIPASLTLTYRFDLLADRYGIPLAPYGRAALERYHWWITDGEGSTTESGATNGWSIAGGLALLLDFFDRQLARELDLDTGVNHTYLFVEARKAVVDDFGSASSWDLSSDGVSYSGGLLFVF
jgi:hypothetical protein